MLKFKKQFRHQKINPLFIGISGVIASPLIRLRDVQRDKTASTNLEFVYSKAPSDRSMRNMIDIKIPSVALVSSRDRALSGPTAFSLARLCHFPIVLGKQTKLDNSQMKGALFLSAHTISA